jgi:hypothetical protein
MKIKINKQTAKNVSEPLLSINFIKDGSDFELKNIDLSLLNLTNEEQQVVNNFIALLEAKTV